MLEPILQSLRDVEGVQGALIIDPMAAVVAHRAHAIYDLSVLQQVARSVVSSVDSVQLIQDDWEMLTAHFGEGKLLLRSLRIAGTRPRRYILTVIADATLNAAFLGVALRVAATKLLAELEAAPQAVPSGQVSGPLASGSTGRVPLADTSRPELAKTGLSWSGSGSQTGSGSGVGSSVGSSDVGVIDSASSTFLSACTKALAASIGPMAKVFVKEAVRKVCGERPFSRSDGPALLAHLAAGIEDSDDRAVFQRATRAL
jgi:predicted regulator of Ras-like GTPase activity (Roadblock/LC7/MglB family)